MIRRTSYLIVPIAFLVLVLAGCGTTGTAPSSGSGSSTPPSSAWVDQFGTSATDAAFAVAADANGNAYLAGDTLGTLTNQKNAGGTDGMLAKIGADGTQAWAVEFGTNNTDNATGVAVDGAGNSYVVGATRGSLGSGKNAGGSDAFLAKFDASGKQLWVDQFGGTQGDAAQGVVLDGSGNVYVVGTTFGKITSSAFPQGGGDVFLAKFDTSGNRLWVKQFGSTKDDLGLAVAVGPSGDVYLDGYTTGGLAATNAGGDDAFVAKYSPKGAPVWVKQFGSAGDDDAMALAVDGKGNALVVGGTSGALGSGSNAGGFDVFVAKFGSSKGKRSWLTQFGTPKDEEGWGATVDANGNTFVTGYASGNLKGTNAGGQDAFVSEIDSSGARVWTTQFGTSADDSGRAITATASGNLLLAGDTDGSLKGTNAGLTDVFLKKYTP